MMNECVCFEGVLYQWLHHEIPAPKDRQTRLLWHKSAPRLILKPGIRNVP